MSDSSGCSSPSPSHNRPIWTRGRRATEEEGEGAAISQFLESGSKQFLVDPMKWEDDDIALRAAAANARMPWDALTAKEFATFPEVTSGHASKNAYLWIRNKILQLWNLDTIVQLTAEMVLRELPPPFDSDRDLVVKIHAFLQRHGYINFGVFSVVEPIRLEKPKKVLVIGAGAAGMTAARQLKFLGFDVKVIEARPRCGGRVMTFKKGNAAADLGAQIVMGITGNPVITLAKQVPVNLKKVNRTCPIYDTKGQMIDARKDDMIQKSFNKILETCSYIAHGLGITEIGGRKISLGAAFENILSQQELRVQRKRLCYWQKYEDICKKLHEINKQLLLAKQTVEFCYNELRQALEGQPADYLNQEFTDDLSEEEFEALLRARCLQHDLTAAIQLHDQAEAEGKELEVALVTYKNMEPSQVYMNETDKRILAFHFANLEYANGAPLSSTSFKDWDMDGEHEFEGSHMMVNEGYGQLIRSLERDLPIETNRVVTKIEFNDEGIRVLAAPNTAGSQDTHEHVVPDLDLQVYEADAVVCTLPLGILKISVSGTNPKQGGPVFEPPLPDWKCSAIRNVGYGSLNKIALMFDKPFWDTSLNLFGRLNESPSSRGEMFLFFANGDNPVLTGLMAGEAASHANNEHREQLVQRAMTILQQIFPLCPARPVNCAVTMWHLDRFSRGCYSYLSTQCSPDDFDVLARPLCDSNEVPRVFFAGEHTNRQYLATVHGAMLSGLREAARVADTFLGPIGGTMEAKLEDEVKPDATGAAGGHQANGHGAAEQSSSASEHKWEVEADACEPPSMLSEMVQRLMDSSSPLSDVDSEHADPLASQSASMEVAEAPMDVEQKAEVASSYATAPDAGSTSGAAADDVKSEDEGMKTPTPAPFSQETWVDDEGPARAEEDNILETPPPAPFSQETWVDDEGPARAEEDDILGDGVDASGQGEIDASMEAEILGEEPDTA